MQRNFLTNMTFLSASALIFGTISGLAGLPQVIKIFKRRSAKDISVITFSLLLLGAITFLLYGIEIKNTPLIAANILAVANSTLVIIGWFLYGGKK